MKPIRHLDPRRPLKASARLAAHAIMHGSLAADQAAHGPLATDNALHGSLATDTAVLVLSGLPASGKTRIASWLLSHSPLQGEQRRNVWGRGLSEGRGEVTYAGQLLLLHSPLEGELCSCTGDRVKVLSRLHEPSSPPCPASP